MTTAETVFEILTKEGGYRPLGKSITMDLLPKLPCPRIFASYGNFFGKD